MRRRMPQWSARSAFRVRRGSCVRSHDGKGKSVGPVDAGGAVQVGTVAVGLGQDRGGAAGLPARAELHGLVAAGALVGGGIIGHSGTPPRVGGLAPLLAGSCGGAPSGAVLEGNPGRPVYVWGWSSVRVGTVGCPRPWGRMRIR